MKGHLARLATLAAAGYAVVLALAWLLQDRLLYFPGPDPSRTPREAGLAFEELTLTTSDGQRLQAWLIGAGKEPETPRGVVLVCNGNAGSIENRLGLARTLVDEGLGVLLFDYRGYGASSGRPDEQGLYFDAVAAYDVLVERGWEGRIAAWGESLGAAVALELALRRPLRGLCLHAPFGSLPAVAAEHYAWLPVGLLLRARYANDEKIAGLDAPLLVLHGSRDRIVPIAHGRALFEHAPEPKQLVEFDAGHNDDPFRSAEVRAAVGDFLRRVLAERD